MGRSDLSPQQWWKANADASEADTNRGDVGYGYGQSFGACFRTTFDEKRSSSKGVRSRSNFESWPKPSNERAPKKTDMPGLMSENHSQLPQPWDGRTNYVQKPPDAEAVPSHLEEGMTHQVSTDATTR